MFCNKCNAKCMVCCSCWYRKFQVGDETTCEFECPHGGTCRDIVFQGRYNYCRGCNMVLCKAHEKSLDINDLCIVCRVEREDSVCIYPHCNITTETDPGDGLECSKCDNRVCSRHWKAFQNCDVGPVCDTCLC